MNVFKKRSFRFSFFFRRRFQNETIVFQTDENDPSLIVNLYQSV